MSYNPINTIDAKATNNMMENIHRDIFKALVCIREDAAEYEFAPFEYDVLESALEQCKQILESAHEDIKEYWGDLLEYDLVEVSEIEQKIKNLRAEKERQWDFYLESFGCGVDERHRCYQSYQRVADELEMWEAKLQ